MFHGKISIEQSILEIYAGLVTQFSEQRKNYLGTRQETKCVCWG